MSIHYILCNSFSKKFLTVFIKEDLQNWNDYLYLQDNVFNNHLTDLNYSYIGKGEKININRGGIILFKLAEYNSSIIEIQILLK